jgi:hypothetical protein
MRSYLIEETGGEKRKKRRKEHTEKGSATKYMRAQKTQRTAALHVHATMVGHSKTADAGQFFPFLSRVQPFFSTHHVP